MRNRRETGDLVKVFGMIAVVVVTSIVFGASIIGHSG
jgi:hypothetical protein